MTTTLISGINFRRIIAMFLAISIFAVTSAFAQTAGKVYDVELAISEGKKTIETDADITFNETSFTVMPDKANFKSAAKTFNYKDIKQADQSYSKKPMLSGGGAIAIALLVGFIFALPFLFIKKKKHWMTVQSGSEFAVIKLGDNNFRQIAAEFETHGVKVNDLKEQEK
ncbi:MAG: hypothetical protein ABI791_15995 [Acidobacteriota bacterium]